MTKKIDELYAVEWGDRCGGCHIIIATRCVFIEWLDRLFLHALTEFLS